MALSWTNAMVQKSDCFVLFTETMADYLKIKNKPYIVMEGLIDNDIFEKKRNSHKKTPEKISILYTGALHNAHGVMRLVEMLNYFEESSNIELWISGKGVLTEEIRRLSELDKRIRFFGAIAKEEVFELQKQATILINPRSVSDDELITRYMFPSKNLEYMLSGNPSIICKMPGIPDDYYQYFIVAENGSPENLYKAVCKVIDMTSEERIIFGEKAQSFVKLNKNYIVQTNRIISLIESTL
jgi:glycosyltransferase involved in cell wall biosynthesis